MTEQEKLAAILEIAVEAFSDRGMIDREIIETVKAELLRFRQNLFPSKSDDAFNAARGAPPMAEAEIREALALEPHEPIPPQRETN
jgi:hypothetical protein